MLQKTTRCPEGWMVTPVVMIAKKGRGGCGYFGSLSLRCRQVGPGSRLLPQCLARRWINTELLNSCSTLQFGRLEGGREEDHGELKGERRWAG